MRMIFHDDLLEAYKASKKYAGNKRRVATMADVIAEKLKSDEWNPLWTTYLYTTSGEFYGRSKKGVPIVVVSHGIYGILDNEDIMSRKPEGQKKFIILTPKEFHVLENGIYGETSVLDCELIRKMQEDSDVLSYEDAWRNPLVRARIGKDTDAFLSRHLEITRKESDNEYVIENQHRYDCLLESDEYTGGLLRISQLLNASRGGDPTSVRTEISVEDMDSGKFVVFPQKRR